MHGRAHGRRAYEVKRGRLSFLQRPGLAKPIILPVKLRKQNDPAAKAIQLKIAPAGKTLVGGQAWVFKKLRPGLARPLLVAAKDVARAEKMMAQAEGASEAAPVMQPKAKAKAKAQAAIKAKAKAAALKGWW